MKDASRDNRKWLIAVVPALTLTLLILVLASLCRGIGIPWLQKAADVLIRRGPIAYLVVFAGGYVLAVEVLALWADDVRSTTLMAVLLCTLLPTLLGFAAYQVALNGIQDGWEMVRQAADTPEQMMEGRRAVEMALTIAPDPLYLGVCLTGLTFAIALLMVIRRLAGGEPPPAP
ncbi:MAG: hypothetical protein JXR37_01215 [Kiritimatiellae bacterium]|nr:hypothetical protein [Kiritimatiellia bacterium]